MKGYKNPDANGFTKIKSKLGNGVKTADTKKGGKVGTNGKVGRKNGGKC
jgi:hypothetical protein